MPKARCEALGQCCSGKLLESEKSKNIKNFYLKKLIKTTKHPPPKKKIPKKPNQEKPLGNGKNTSYSINKE